MEATNKKQAKVWHKGLISQLEPRLMYDGAAVVAAVEVVAATESESAPETHESVDAQNTPVATDQGPTDENNSTSSSTTVTTTEVVEALNSENSEESDDGDNSQLLDLTINQESSGENTTSPSTAELLDALETAPDSENDINSSATSFDEPIDENNPESEILASTATLDATDDTRTEIAFIDASVKDADVLVAGIDPSIDIYYLDNNSSGLSQMADILADKHDIDAIHLFSHGSSGDLTLGSEHLTSDNINSNANDLGTIGQAMDENGDILLYGCSVGQDSEFIDQIAELTGADVVASDDATGSNELGGDWQLEINHGVVDTAAIGSETYNLLLGTPSVTGLNDTTYIENSGPVIIDGSISITNGSTYDGQYIDFSLTNTESSDQLTLTSASNVNASGAISIVGASVYLGNGSSRDVIGSIDSTYNGENGQKLRVNFVNDFANGGLETGTIDGWTAMNQMIDLGSTSIAGFISQDTSDYSTNTNAGGNDNDVPVSSSYTTQISSTEHSDGNYSLQLTSSMTTLNGYDVVHGPAVYSSEFEASAGDKIYFDWRAKNGSDDFDAFGYIINTSTGVQTEVLDATGASTTAWVTKETTISTAGTYRFVFVNGTYDASGGKAAGGQLFVDNVRVYGSKVNDVVVSSIASQIAFENTSDNPSTTDRTLTVTAVNSDNLSGSGSSIIHITAVNDAPVINGGSASISISTNEDTPHNSSPLSVADPDDTSHTWSVSSAASNGSASVNSSNGAITYTPDANWHGSDSFTVQVSDGEDSDTITVNVTVNSINDVPTINVTGSNAIIEPVDGSAYNIIDSGTVSFDDVDTPDLIDITFTSNGDITWSGGTVDSALATQLVNGFNTGATNAAAPGTTGWSYNVTGANLDFLAKDETITYSYTVTANDGLGGVSTDSITFTITGTNDDPTVASTNKSFTEATDASAQSLIDSGTVSFDDIDTNDVIDISFVSNSDIAWSGGAIDPGLATQLVSGFITSANNAAAPGSIGWAYNVANANLDFLAKDETITFSYTVTATDNTGGLDTTTVLFTINGSNDAPVITAVDVAGDITRGISLTDNGSITFADLDLTDLPTTTQVTKTVTATLADNSTPLPLTAGQHAAIVAGFSIDVVAGNSNNGTINWAYIITEAELDFLAAGETITAVFTITANDSNGGSASQDVTVTINDTNEIPTVSVSASGGFTEAVNGSRMVLSESGTVTFDDLDGTDVIDITFASNNDIAWSGGTIKGALAAQLVAGFTTKATDAQAPGTTAWTYSSTGTNLDFLAKGETITFSYTVTATDNTGATATDTVAFTITGTNDTGVAGSLPSPQSSQAFQPFQYSIPASTFTDVDTNDGFSYSVAGLPRGLTFSASNLQITGTPTEAGTFTIIVTARDQSGATTQVSFSITIDPAPVTVLPSTQPVAGGLGDAPTPMPADIPSIDPGPEIPLTTDNGEIRSRETSFGDDTGKNSALLDTILDGTNTWESGIQDNGAYDTSFEDIGEQSSGDKPGEKQTDISREIVRVDSVGQLQFDEQSEKNSAVSLSVESLQIDSDTQAFTLKLYIDSKSTVSNYTATLGDGSELPHWLKFDPITGTITGQPPAGTEKIELKIEVVNEEGDTEILLITVDFEVSTDLENIENDIENTTSSVIGLQPLSAQLEEMGRVADCYGDELLEALA